MKKFTEEIDIIASYVESKGFIEEAEQLDIISNTIEKNSFQMNKNVEEAKNIILRASVQFGKGRVKRLIDDTIMRSRRGDKVAAENVESYLKFSWGAVVGAVLLLLKIFGQPALEKLKSDIDEIRTDRLEQIEMAIGQ